MTALLPYGLTVRGFIGARAADALAYMQAVAEAKANRPIDWSERNPIAHLYVIAADLFGQVAQSGLEAGYNARRRANAAGSNNDDLGVLINKRRLPGLPSTAPATLSGVPGTVVPFGRFVERTEDRTRWIVAQDTTIGGGGTGATVLRAAKNGPTVAAQSDPFTVTTPVAGWTGVSLTAAATPGRTEETDDDYRRRQAQAMTAAGTRSESAVLAAVRNLDGVLDAVSQDNDEAGEVVKNGITMRPGSFAVVVHPSTLTTTQRDTLARTLYRQGLIGIYWSGPVEWSVTGRDRAPKVVRWTWATTSAKTIGYVLTLADGFELADVEPDLRAAVVAYAADWRMQTRVSLLTLYGFAGAIEGIIGAAVLIDGVAADYAAALTVIPTLNAGTSGSPVDLTITEAP